MLLPPWDMNLPQDLRRFGEVMFLHPLGLSVRDYSTARFLSRNPAREKKSAGLVSLGAATEPVIVEVLDATILNYFADRGLTPNDTTDAVLACQCISEAACEIVGLVPCCAASMTELVRSIHLIASAGEEYDSSHSDPEIPFSIFVSVPTSKGRRSVLRVAEGLVHEAMHLQLSLYEAICPLVDGSVEWGIYSPWKQTKRETQGILHGLYVFGVLKWMWQHVQATISSDEERRFAEIRIHEITEDVEAVRGVIESPALTADGRRFVDSVLRHAAV